MSRKRDALTFDGTTYRVGMVWSGDGRSAKQTHHLEVEVAGSEERLACGVDPARTEPSNKTLLQWLECGYGVCRRCAKSPAAKALDGLLAERRAVAAAQAEATKMARAMDDAHAAALWEHERWAALRAAATALSGTSLTPAQVHALARALAQCGADAVVEVVTK